jgi:molecular chaperone GrpE
MTEASNRSAAQEQEEPRVVVRDKRRLDPTTGAVRPEAAAAAAAASAGPADADAAQADAEVAQLLATIDERTADLQRLKAEFDNSRRRVERDRLAVAEQATAAALAQLLPVLDDIDRARQHGEVTGGFKVVADNLEATLGKLGLARFGTEGDQFDPMLHEAVMHSESPDVDGPTCVSVMRAGYTYLDRLLRPAMVAVAEPPATGEPAEDSDVTDVVTAETAEGSAAPEGDAAHE